MSNRPLDELTLRYGLQTIQGRQGRGLVDRVSRVFANAKRVRATQVEVLALARNNVSPIGASEGAVVADRLEMLRRRLVAVAPALPAELRPAPTASVRELVTVFVRQARLGEDKRYYWLLLSASAAVFPSITEIDAFRRESELVPEDQVAEILLRHVWLKLLTAHAHYRTVRLVGGVVVDVDYCAKHNFNSGIQRVTRSLLAEWSDRDDVTPVAWTNSGVSYRALTTSERRRVFAWSDAFRYEGDVEQVEDPHEVLIPWNAKMFLPDVPKAEVTRELAGLAAHSGNPVTIIGYDLIPALSGSFVTTGSSAAFAVFGEVIKYSRSILAISHAVGEEFAGFTDALAAQGLRGPRIDVVTLPTVGVGEARDAEPERDASVVPLVLSVGSFEPRKNQVALLNGAELLWRKGRKFSVVMIGGGSQAGYREVWERYADLVIAGRPVSVVTGVTDKQLAEAYGKAKASVFLSLHEGFGLPVVEAYAAGVPVIYTNYGSVNEVGQTGGGIAVDPRDPQAVADALEAALFDEAVGAQLRQRIRDRVVRRWSDYAEEVWKVVTDDERVQKGAAS